MLYALVYDAVVYENLRLHEMSEFRDIEEELSNFLETSLEHKCLSSKQIASYGVCGCV